MTDIGRLRELLAEATPAPWTVTRDYGGFPHDIRAESREDCAKIFDVRGWGYFTGKGSGALGLPKHEAEAIMNANANFVTEFRNAAPHLLSEIETLRARLAAALAAMQELVNYDNGGSGDGGAILEAAEKILASRKENADG